MGLYLIISFAMIIFPQKEFYYYRNYEDKSGDVKEVENLNYKQFARET